MGTSGWAPIIHFRATKARLRGLRPQLWRMTCNAEVSTGAECNAGGYRKGLGRSLSGACTGHARSSPMHLRMQGDVLTVRDIANPSVEASNTKERHIGTARIENGLRNELGD
jgi:hypothetical protein